MRETEDKNIFLFFNISKKTWYNYKNKKNPKHRIYLAMIHYWEHVAKQTKS